jgi:hypothetical protein
MKKKLLLVILFCLGITGMALAGIYPTQFDGDANRQVISIDLNGYNDGNAPAAGWNVYYGGWGKPMGSPRSANLRDYNEPNLPSTYAAQVWIGDNGKNHYYKWGSGVMDDGFIQDPNAEPNDPNISLFGQDAYQGTFDIYVYGDTPGDFNLTVNGTKRPQVISANSVGMKIIGSSYDVAYETNARDSEGQHFGPDIDNTVPGRPGIVVYIDSGEYMEYDITVNDANEGRYAICAGARTTWGPASVPLYLDDKPLGIVDRPEGYDDVEDTNSVNVNLYGRSEKYIIKWQVPARAYFDLGYLKFTWLGDVNMPDCNAVYAEGFEYAADLNHDCHVDYKDLYQMTQNWLKCESPDPNECP